jgi:hypothetical protein
MKLLIMQFSPPSYNFINLKTEKVIMCCLVRAIDYLRGW